MHSILVPLDGSALAERVLPHVRELAMLLRAKICLYQSLLDQDYDDMLTESLLKAYGIADTAEALRERKQRAADTLRHHAEGYLATQARYLQDVGLDVEIEVNVGIPDKTIGEVARERQATLIAMATHGYGGLKRWTLGSVTNKVVHTATTPVLVVRGAEAPTTAPQIQRILVPLDGSAFSQQALPLAAELAARANAELILLEVIAPAIEAATNVRLRGRLVPHYAEMVELLHWHAQLELGVRAERLRARGLRVQVSTVNGHAAEAIVEQAERQGADLIVMATHGYSGLKRWALGSVADKVLHAATIPVALVRAQANEGEIGASVEMSGDVTWSPTLPETVYQKIQSASMPIKGTSTTEEEVRRGR